MSVVEDGRWLRYDIDTYHLPHHNVMTKFSTLFFPNIHDRIQSSSSFYHHQLVSHRKECQGITQLLLFSPGGNSINPKAPTTDWHDNHCNHAVVSLRCTDTLNQRTVGTRTVAGVLARPRVKGRSVLSSRNPRFSQSFVRPLVPPCYNI